MERREFIQLSAGTAVSVIAARLLGDPYSRSAAVQAPDRVWAKIDGAWVAVPKQSEGLYQFKDLLISTETRGEDVAVYIQTPVTQLQAVRFNWKFNATGSSLGDHWERGYGDLAWKPVSREEAGIARPWYLLIHDRKQTVGFGVKTQANTICSWTIAPAELTLTMDTLNGSMPPVIGDRKLHACTIQNIRRQAPVTPYQALTDFCGKMCPDPRLPAKPVYGINDWYAVYGNNSFDSIRDQTAAMAELVTDTNNRPFSVIDDGWQIPDDFQNPNEKFKDMAKMGETIRSLGMRPGLWTRPLIAHKNDPVSMLSPVIPGRDQGDSPILDPTIPEVIGRIQGSFAMYRIWGYEMIKHDYTSFDMFGRWGFQMKDGFTAPGWHFQDRSMTNAEIMNHLYRSIREAAGSMYVIGCNTFSHLSAGVFELNRTGDDTSGKEWARTKKMGVNTLGFRLAQHNKFYAADGDCVGLTKEVPWDKNRQWLQLLAESGSPLFVSAQLDALGAEQKKAVKIAFAQAARVQPTGEPLDWLSNPFPSKWKLNERDVKFNWG